MIRVTHDASSDDNAENIDDDDVLKLSLSAILIASIAKKNIEIHDRLLGRVGCGQGGEVIKLERVK